MQLLWATALVWVIVFVFVTAKNDTTAGTTFPTKSGIRIWVDPATPDDRQTYTNSRGRKWDLVMSDEFNMPNRSFRPGHDHIWTSLEKPDGVNGALELYSHNMTSTRCDDDGTCYFYIKSVNEVNVIHVYNMYTHPPSFVDAYFFYRAAMVQSWNKFCYQGGMVETRVQLPGVVTPESGNPDLANGKNSKVKTGKYYPTWPGIWMMGNLGRAIFSASTNRMWPFSYDKYLSLIDGKGEDHWGINSNGTCYPLWNVYTGAYLCDPDNTFWKCAKPRNATTTPKSNAMSQFNYQMDAISSNWPVHVGAYTDYVVYQVEWVTGKNGYVRWMLQGSPLFEVPSESIWDIPQNANKTNPQKIMLEEPMYLIFNVALSSSWGATPPNPGEECRGDGSDEEVNKICDAFPLYLKIDYIRLYQDLASDLEADNYMHIGCDPKTHPTKKWIEAHIDEYQDDDNQHKEVAGKAFCKTNNDCTIGGTLGKTSLKTGTCVKGRCQCSYSSSWGGPRCTTAISSSSGSVSSKISADSYGPPMGLSIVVAAIAVLLSFASVAWSIIKENKADALLKKNKGKSALDMAMASNLRDEARLDQVKYTTESGSYGNDHTLGHGRDSRHRPKDNYSQNFV
ncbi:Beta-glucan synthesis-associated protein [Phytophthora megakarya]|uniref:Beta-glucan synthesis-associated protein n=1 Tax=Phytophthora megakarya TaxID=4795 RepID=A0A225WM96_9STRA|nr:Beta-glucan synthesis-associated protein [Phytophthora megakarya]